MDVVKVELNGKKVALHKDAIIEVQVGKGGKGSYKTKHIFTAKDFGQAVMTYNGINVGKGHKKRLFCLSLNNPILAKAQSYSASLSVVSSF